LTEKSITVAWDVPSNQGGCPVFTYKVKIDDGNAGSFSEANTASDPAVRNITTLR
jgi:hypothetical protein